MSYKNDQAITVKDLGKCYSIYNQPQDRLKQSILPRIQKLIGKEPLHYYHDFWALKNVSFEVNRGETMGIIGRNGSGKSTLLQIISGTLTPTTGEVLTRGRVCALLELGSGFNPEFTGRENIFLNAALLGFSNSQISTRIDEILAFADIGEFIDQPVKMYSSGMFVRLAFAIAVNTTPDILIIDEALSVGDIRFQNKCLRKIENLRESGCTILFVSHSPAQVEALCENTIWLENGSIKDIGSSKKLIRSYINYMVHNLENDSPKEENENSSNTPSESFIRPDLGNNWIRVSENRNIVTNGKARIERFRIMNESKEFCNQLISKPQRILLDVEIEFLDKIISPLFAVGIMNSLNQPIVHFNSQNIGQQLDQITVPTKKLIKVAFEIPGLFPGDYLLVMGIDDGVMGSSEIVYHIYDAAVLSFLPYNKDLIQGGFAQAQSVKIEVADIGTQTHEL